MFRDRIISAPEMEVLDSMMAETAKKHLSEFQVRNNSSAASRHKFVCVKACRGPTLRSVSGVLHDGTTELDSATVVFAGH